jgi:signal transduction histidine kinase
MEGSIVLEPMDEAGSGGAYPRGLQRFLWSPGWCYLVTGVFTTVFFAADVILPRGATVAIGYCVVPAVAAGTRRRRFLFGMTVACTVLTWVAFFVEPKGYPAWKSAFDRTMVTAAMWFALLLVVRRAALISVLQHQKQVLKDTTLELERSNEELERSNEELANFASVVAHDLRGPLNTVALNAQLLSSCEPVKVDAECRDNVDSIQAELAQMAGFIQSLLNYGRIGSGALRIVDCDCAAVLRDVRQNLKADLDRNGAKIENDPLPIIRADPVLIAQLFQNLIENSIKYQRDVPPRVHVSCSERPDSWLFSVRDNGIGIGPEDTERIFQPFHQTGGGRRTRGGVGLGLATCKRVVERHGGSINAQSKLGQGTTFLFTIPRPSLASKRADLLEPQAPSLAVQPAGPTAAANQVNYHGYKRFSEHFNGTRGTAFL